MSVVAGAVSVPSALAAAAEQLALKALPPVSHVCPRCGSDRHGRPFLPGRADVHVSISRSTGVLVVAVSLGARVGVDVERAGDERFAEVAEVVGHPLESTPDLGRAAITWVRKEAVVKAWASGLSVDPRTIRLSPPDEPPVVVTAPAAYDGLPTRLVDLALGDGLVGCVAVVSTRQPDVSVVRAGAAAASRGARPARGR